jgi:hypothetical protein
MPNQNTNTNHVSAVSPTAFHSIAGSLLGISTPPHHDPIAQAMRGPRRFHVHEDFSGGAWDGTAGLIGSED